MSSFPSLLLQTKLNRPQVIGDLVERPRLVEKLNRGLDRKLTLVAAPAGYGKTTLVCQWLDNCDRSAAWLSLDEHDNDLTLFLNYLIAAIRTLCPGACHETGLLARAERLPPVEYIVTTLINDITALPEPFILVLDDYHVITERMIHELTDRFICYLPTQMHLVLCSRTDPPMPLSLLRGRQQINELRLNELRFSLEEAQEFLQQAMGEPVDGKFTELVERRTEGWVTGLRLAVLSMRDSQDYQTFLADFGGDTNIMLVDYLMEEVLSRQSPSHQHFLIRTAILDRFCAPLCDAILAADDDASPAGGRVFVSSQEAILSLERSGIFIMALDDRRQWYRYHDLFRDMLRQRFHDRLSPEEQADINRRASAWYGDHGHIDQALQYALAGDDVAGAVHLVEQHRISVMNQGGGARWSAGWTCCRKRSCCHSRHCCSLRAWFLTPPRSTGRPCLFWRKPSVCSNLTKPSLKRNGWSCRRKSTPCLLPDYFLRGSTSRRWRWPAMRCNIYLQHTTICAASPWIFNALRNTQWGARMQPFNS